MIDVKVQVVDTTKAVKDAAEKGAFKSFAHAAASIRLDVISSIYPALDLGSKKTASQPGRPPFTHRGHLPRSIRFAADQFGAVIGPVASVVGLSGSAHEFGGSYGDQNYPARPFMQPALVRSLPRLMGDFSGMIG